MKPRSVKYFRIRRASKYKPAFELSGFAEFIDNLYRVQKALVELSQPRRKDRYKAYHPAIVGERCPELFISPGDSLPYLTPNKPQIMPLPTPLHFMPVTDRLFPEFKAPKIDRSPAVKFEGYHYFSISNYGRIRISPSDLT